MGCGESKLDELEEEQRGQLASEKQLTPEKQPVSKLNVDDVVASTDDGIPRGCGCWVDSS